MVNTVSFIILGIFVAGFLIMLYLHYKQYKKNKELGSSFLSIMEIFDTNNIKAGEIDDFNLIFLKKKIIESNDKELVDYLIKLYTASSKGGIRNFQRIKQLENDIIDYGIIRMNTLENTFDISKILAPTITITIFFFSAYITFFQQVLLKDYEVYQYLILIGVSAVLYVSISSLIKYNRLRHMAVLYFKNLLEYANNGNKN